MALCARSWRGRRRKSGEGRIRAGGFKKSETNSTCAGRLPQARFANSVQSACNFVCRVFVHAVEESRCRFTHDVKRYLAAKPRDIKFPALSDISIQLPFASLGDEGARTDANQVAESRSSLDSTTICPVYAATGRCKHGFKCRFLGAHVKATADDFSDELSLVVDGDKAAHAAVSAAELNFVGPDVRKQLRTRKVVTCHSSRHRGSADGLHCGTTRVPPDVCTVSEADFGRLSERDPTIAEYKRRGNPRTNGGDRGQSNRVL